MSRKWLIKSTGVIGAATAASRVLGFVRDIVIANFFGTSMVAQAFFVAFRIPNSLRDLIGEGAANAAIVPVLTEYRNKGDEKEFLRISRVLFNISFLALSVITVAGILFSPLIVRLIAPGFIREGAVFNLTVQLNRVIFPYLILIGLTAYTMGILNTLKHFASPAFGPCLLNLALIGAAVWLCPTFGVMGLAIGVLLGGTLQLLLNWVTMHVQGVRMDFRDGFRHPAVKRIGLLLIPRAFGSAVYQINIFVDTMLASLTWIVGAGGVAALYYANRLIQFPLAIIALALAQAALPKMSEEFTLKDMAKLRDTISFSLRATFFVMLPASVGLAVLGTPIVKILFERGEFTAYSTAITESALFFYSFGLCAYSGIKLLVTCFYAMQDTMTPVKTAFTAVLINIVLNLLLMWPLKLGGLALATSISATINFFTLYHILEKRIGDFGTRVIADSFIRILLASLAMGAIIMLVSHYMGGLTGLCVSIAIGMIAFIISAYIFRVQEMRGFLGWILKKR